MRLATSKMQGLGKSPGFLYISHPSIMSAVKNVCFAIATVPFLLFSDEPLRIGFAALHLPSLSTIEQNSDQYFPPASTFKLILAVYCLQKEPDLHFKLVLKNHDLRDGAGILKSQFREGMECSIRELIELMMIYSDNTATDLLLERCGSPIHLTEWLRSIGIEEITITNSCFDILASYYGINHLSPDCTLEIFEAHKQEVSLIVQQNASQVYLTEMPDRATPRGMLLFLKKLINNELLSEDLKIFLLQCMQKSAM